MSSPKKPTWTGKAKATERDFNDLNPIITYRHLFAQNLGVRDPLRVIALCDSDAFYAACEMVRLEVDKETPLVVLQWEALIAVNYAARKFGISRMDKLKDALERCPHLKVVHVATYKEGEKEPGYWDNVDTNTHKVSLDYYRRESVKISKLFKELLVECEVEKASIDEAFFDFSKPVREILLQRYPYLATVPPNAPDGVDTPLPPPPPIHWDDLGWVIPINPPPPSEQVEEENKGQENDIDQEKDKVQADVSSSWKDEESIPTWHDVALSIAAELMGSARAQVLQKLGYSTSAGIARNKFLAKLTASYKKPNSQSILRNAAIPNYLKPIAFRKIRFLGGKLGKAFAQEYDASTVSDLLSIDLDDMQNKFGEESIWVYEVLRGIDRAEVKDKGSVLNKSMLASKNLPKPIKNASEGHHWIRVLAAELALRLNDARKESPNLWPKTLVLHARKGYEAGRSKQAPFPFTREITVDYIATLGDKLWKELVGNNVAMNVSSVQLAFTGIDVTEVGQQSIEGFLQNSRVNKRSREDGINPDQHFQSDNTRAPDDQSNIRPSYTCPRCSKTYHLPDATSGVDSDVALKALRMEHEDFHFAQDLTRESDQVPIVVGSPRPLNKNKKQRKEPVGIEKFFGRK